MGEGATTAARPPGAPSSDAPPPGAPGPHAPELRLGAAEPPDPPDPSDPSDSGADESESPDRAREVAGGMPAAPGGPERRGPERKGGSSIGLYPARNPGRSTRIIGEVAVDLGFADLESVEEAVAAARAQGRPTGIVLVERGVLRHDQLARVVAERFGLDFVDLSVYDLDMGAVNLIG